MNRICANCEESIIGAGFEADGRPFCCAGCAAGGPCRCTYSEADTRNAVLIPHEPPAEDRGPAEPQPLAWPAPERVEPAARRRPSILRVAGLTSQFDLLRLGAALEEQRCVEDLSLVRADLDDAWFAVTMRDPEDLADALVAVEGFDVDARPHPAGVDATVTAHPAATGWREPSPFEPASAAVAAEEARPRFRVFQRADDAAPVATAAEPFASGAAAEPPAAMSRTPEHEATAGMVTAEQRPGGAVAMREHITLVAYPFRSFVALNEFQDALRALRGVVNVKVRRFYRGTLHLGVEYEDVLPLTERLREIDSFSWRLVSSSPQEIELMIEEQGDLVSSG